MSEELQIYKVRFHRKDCGKNIKSSKRVLTWRFGLAKGTGGIFGGIFGGKQTKKEHEITLIWSVTSGKRVILIDGLQRHYSQGMWMKDTFKRRWSWKGIAIDMVAHSSRPVRGVDPTWIQYDLKLNGTRFHLLPEEDEIVAVNLPIMSTQAKNLGSKLNPSKPEQSHDTIRNTAIEKYTSFKTMDQNVRTTSPSLHKTDTRSVSTTDTQSVWTTPPSLEKTDTIDRSEVASFFDSPSVKEQLSLHSSPSSTSKMTNLSQSTDSDSDSDSEDSSSFATMDDSVDDSVSTMPMEHVKTINMNEMRKVLEKSKSPTASQKELMKNSPDDDSSLTPSSCASHESDDGFLCSFSFQPCGKYSRSKVKLSCCS